MIFLFGFFHASQGPNPGGPKGGGPKGGGPKGGGPKGGGPKISRFIFPVPPQNSFFSSLSGSLLVEFWWCLKRRDAQMCTFGVLWLSCEAPAARSCGAGGVSHGSPRAQTCTFERPSTKNQREDHPEREERKKFPERERKKKSEILGGPGEGRSRRKAVQGKGGPNQTEKHPHMKPHSDTVKQYPRTQTTQHTTTHNKSKSFWPKSVWAQVGFGQSRSGQSRP